MKVCSKCKVEKSEGEFNKCSTVKSGLRSYCIECQKIINKKSKEKLKNKEKIQIISKTCSQCKQERNMIEFYKCNTNLDGLHSNCKCCVDLEKKNKRKQQNSLEKTCKECGIKKLNINFRQNRHNRTITEDTCKACEDKHKKIEKQEYIKTITHKVCYTCKQIKELSQFGALSKSIDGHRGECLECHRNKNRVFMCRKRQDFSFRKLENILHKEWRAKKIKEEPWYFKLYNEKNKNKSLKHGAERRMRVLEKTIVEFSMEELNQRLSVFGFRCAYCGGPFEHLDHVKPLISGGPHCLSNLRPACAKCNLSKGKKTLKEWTEWKKLMNKDQK